MAKKNKGWDYLNSDDVNSMSDEMCIRDRGSTGRLLQMRVK